MSRSLADALQSREREDFAEKLAAYVAARNRFQSLLDGDDYNYFAFQVWQEGVARYTEYQVAALAAAEYEPSRPFRDLKDYTSFADDARALLDGVERELASVQLDQTKRVASMLWAQRRVSCSIVPTPGGASSTSWRSFPGQAVSLGAMMAALTKDIARMVAARVVWHGSEAGAGRTQGPDSSRRNWGPCCPKRSSMSRCP